jgi:hypothetical protein
MVGRISVALTQTQIAISCNNQWKVGCVLEVVELALSIRPKGESAVLGIAHESDGRQVSNAPE